MNIIHKQSPNFKEGRQGYKIELIVLHIMAGSLKGTDEWFLNPASKVSAHYGVGFNGEVHQYVDVDNTAWANGIVNKPTAKLLKPNINPNLYTISIENEGQDLSIAPETQLNAIVELLQGLSRVYSIPIDRDHIIGHYEIDGVKKINCPAIDKSIIDKIVTRAKSTDKQAIKTEIKRLIDLL